MFCPEGNIPLSVFKTRWEDAFDDAFNHHKIVDYVTKVENEDKDDFEYRILSEQFESYLCELETLTATSPDGISLQIDINQLFRSPKKLFFFDEEIQKIIIQNGSLDFMFVHPITFTISLAAWDNFFLKVIKSFKEKYNTGYFEGIVHNAECIKPFEGWGLSIPREVSDAALKNIPNLYPFEEKVEKRGRQRKKKARDYWQFNLKFDKEGKSWEQTIRKIKSKTGETPSPKSLRDWSESPLPPRE